MKDEYIHKLRAFNRFYTNVLGLLDKHILDSDYSLIEARILFEICHTKNIMASEIMVIVDIDKGYLSRILKKFEKNGLINKSVLDMDKRAATIQITEGGKQQFEMLDKASNNQARGIFKNLSEIECMELVKKLDEIQKLIIKGNKS